MDLFDSPWKIAILAILIIVFFGAAKLPVVARSLGKSMRILKTEVRGLHDDDETSDSTASAQAAPAQLEASTPAQPDSQTRIADLQKQLNDLREKSGTDGSGTDSEVSTEARQTR